MKPYPGDKPTPYLCELAWCTNQLGYQTSVTLRSGQVVEICGHHAGKLRPETCDCTFFLLVPGQPGTTALRCDLPYRHSGHHRHPHSTLQWGSAE